MKINKQVCSFLLMTTISIGCSMQTVSYGQVNNTETLEFKEDNYKQLTSSTRNLEFAGGNGEQYNPYIIETQEHLDNVRSFPDAYFKQKGDILLRSAIMNSGKGWKPIGDSEEPFTGHYDGNGYSISKLYINRGGENNIGLFGIVGDGATFNNIKLSAVTIVGSYWTGGLIGSTLEDSRVDVSECSVEGNITGQNYTGGLIGLHYEGDVKNSNSDIKLSGSSYTGGLIGRTSGEIYNTYSKGDIISSGTNVGGLIGSLETEFAKVEKSYSNCDVYGNNYNSNSYGGLIGTSLLSSIEESYSTGSVTGRSYTGGFIGINKGIINKAYSTGKVSGGQYTGGFCGKNNSNIMVSSSTGNVDGGSYTGGFIGDNSGMVTQSYSLNNVISEGSYIGGFIGENNYNTGISINECFSAGTVKGYSSVGGFIGNRYNDESMIVDNYYDSDTSGIKKSINGITPKTTSEMKKKDSYQNWDFTYTWSLKEVAGYPSHIWNTENTSVNVTGIKLNTSLAIIKVGGNPVNLVATVMPEDATNKNIKWYSSDKSVATVDAYGKVAATGQGEAQITAETEDGGKTARCKVTVSKDVENNKPEDNTDDSVVTPDVKPVIGDNFSQTYEFSDLISDTTKFNQLLESYTSTELKVIIPSVQLINMKTTHTPGILTNFRFKTGNKVRKIKIESGDSSRIATRIESDTFNCDWAGLERGAEVIVYLYDENEVEIDKKVVRLKEGVHESKYGESSIKPGNYVLLDLLSDSTKFNNILSSYSLKSLIIGVPIRYITNVTSEYGIYTTKFTVNTATGVDRVTILTSSNQEVEAHSQGAGVYTADVSGLKGGATVNVRAYDSKGKLLYQKPAFVD